MEQNSAPLPLEETDPVLAEHIRQVANGEHPAVKTIIVDGNAIQILEKVGRPRPRKLPGRNEPCYCGSGKKFKKCCLA